MLTLVTKCINAEFICSPLLESTEELGGWHTTKHSRSFVTSSNLATIPSQLQMTMPSNPVKDIFSAILQPAEVNLSLYPVHIFVLEVTTAAGI